MDSWVPFASPAKVEANVILNLNFRVWSALCFAYPSKSKYMCNTSDWWIRMTKVSHNNLPSFVLNMFLLIPFYLMHIHRPDSENKSNNQFLFKVRHLITRRILFSADQTGCLFTKQTGVLSPHHVKSRSWKMGFENLYGESTFYRWLGSNAVDMPVKFQKQLVFRTFVTKIDILFLKS